jgi:hypothetical protein
MTVKKKHITSWRKIREQIACSAGQSTLSFGDINIDVDNDTNTTTIISSPAYPNEEKDNYYQDYRQQIQKHHHHQCLRHYLVVVTPLHNYLRAL